MWRLALAVAGIVAGAAGVLFWLISKGTFDIPPMVACGVLAVVGIGLGSATLVPTKRDRRSTILALVSIILGTLALTGQLAELVNLAVWAQYFLGPL